MMDSEPVLPSAIIFSDGKIRDAETGKLTLTGIFHRIQASKVPFVSTPFFATVFITNFHGEIRELPVTMNIEDASGQIVATVAGRISATEIVSFRDMAEISFPIAPIEFKVAGHYRTVVLIDGEPVGSRGFNVTL